MQQQRNFPLSRFNSLSFARLFSRLVSRLATPLMLTLAMFANPTAIAQTTTPEALPAFGTPERETTLARLYDKLQMAKEPSKVQALERNIWQIWLHHGDPEVDQLMVDAQSARREFNFEKAVLLTNEIIELAPEYAEGWNQRATLRYLQESYEASLKDVAEVLKREPNHFGALSGRALIRYRQGKPALAIQNLLEALKVNPHLREKGLLDRLGYKETKV